MGVSVLRLWSALDVSPLNLVCVTGRVFKCPRLLGSCKKLTRFSICTISLSGRFDLKSVQILMIESVFLCTGCKSSEIWGSCAIVDSSRHTVGWIFAVSWGITFDTSLPLPLQRIDASDVNLVLFGFKCVDMRKRRAIVDVAHSLWSSKQMWKGKRLSCSILERYVLMYMVNRPPPKSRTHILIPDSVNNPRPWSYLESLSSL